MQKTIPATPEVFRNISVPAATQKQLLTLVCIVNRDKGTLCSKQAENSESKKQSSVICLDGRRGRIITLCYA